MEWNNLIGKADVIKLHELDKTRLESSGIKQPVPFIKFLLRKEVLLPYEIYRSFENMMNHFTS